MPDHHNKRVIYQRFRDRMSDCSDGLLQFLLGRVSPDHDGRPRLHRLTAFVGLPRTLREA